MKGQTGFQAHAMVYAACDQGKYKVCHGLPAPVQWRGCFVGLPTQHPHPLRLQFACLVQNMPVCCQPTGSLQMVEQVVEPAEVAMCLSAP